MNDPIGAEKYFLQATALNQYIYKSYYYYGNFLFQQKRYDEAIFNLKNAINIDPRYFDARFALLNLYSETQDWGNLKNLAEETLQLIPDDARCIKYIEAAKNKKTKLDVLIELARVEPTSANYINLSLKYYEVGQYMECISACKEAIKIKPNNAIAYNNICSAYNQLKMYEKAIEACNQALAIDPGFQLAKGNLNSAKSQLNKK